MTATSDLMRAEMRRHRLSGDKNRPGGEMASPQPSAGLVVFCPETKVKAQLHNAMIGAMLHRHRLTTFTPDLCPACGHDSAQNEERAAQLGETAQWLCQSQQGAAGQVGCYARGPENAAAVLTALAARPAHIHAAVLCGGVADDAADILPHVKAPVLLIAGGRDSAGLRAAQRAIGLLGGACALNIIPRASAALEEPGVVEEIAQLSALWFLEKLDGYQHA